MKDAKHWVPMFQGDLDKSFLDLIRLVQSDAQRDLLVANDELEKRVKELEASNKRIDATELLSARITALEKENTELRKFFDWTEAILCNSLPQSHCSIDKWGNIIHEWRERKHGNIPLSEPLDSAAKEGKL